MRGFPVVLLIATLAWPTLANTETLRIRARAAAQAQDYCAATYYFEWIYDDTGAPKELYNAAEVAFAADDRGRALRLYQKLRDRHRGFRKMDTVRERLQTLAGLMADTGFGSECEAPPKPDDSGPSGKDPPDKDPPDKDPPDKDPPDKDPPDKDPPEKDPPDKGKCGDAKVSGDEICDDGNTENGDGCDNNCKPSGCLNGIQAGEEQCDDGNVNDGDGCDTNCTVTACGNGIVTQGEQCDDGNLEDGDGCSAMCAPDEATETGGSSALAWVTAATGVALLAGGGALGYIGLEPVLRHRRFGRQLDELEASLLDETDPNVIEEGLANAEDLNRDQRLARADFERYGQLSAIGGASLVVLGLGASIGGVVWALSSGE